MQMVAQLEEYFFVIICERCTRIFRVGESKVMVEQVVCPSCGLETPSEYNFCVTCNKQVRCLNAGSGKMLIAGKSVCFGCGKPIESAGQEANLTTLVRRTKRRGENYDDLFELKTTQEVAIALAGGLLNHVLNSAAQRPFSPTKQTGTPAANISPAITDGLFAGQADFDVPPEEVSNTPPQTPSTSGASNYFTRDGAHLLKMGWDYKGSSWADQQRRFLLLYTSAYVQEFQESVPDLDHFKAVAEEAKIIDKINFNRYLKGLIGKELTKKSDGYILSYDGIKTVERILEEMSAPGAKAGYDYTKQTPSDGKEKRRLSDKEKDVVEEWTAEKVELGKLEIRVIEQARDYAMVALWMLQVYLKKREAFLWNEAYLYITKCSSHVKATPEAFSRALANPNNKDYFGCADGHYFLTPKAQEIVEGWTAGRSVKSGKDKGAK